MGLETRFNPRQRSPVEPGTGQPELSDARGMAWAFGCQLWTLMPSPAPALQHDPYPCVAPRGEQRRQETPCPQQSSALRQGTRDPGTSGDTPLPGCATSKDQNPIWLRVGMPRGHLLPVFSPAMLRLEGLMAPSGSGTVCPSLSPSCPHVASTGPAPQCPWLGAVLGGGVQSWPMWLPAQGQGVAPAKSPAADQPREVIEGDREEELSRR